MLNVNPERFLKLLHTLRRFGASGQGKGLVRPAFTTDELAARDWVGQKMQAAGLELQMDAVGNQFGIAPGGGLLLGSHTCLLYTSPSPRDKRQSRMPSSA